MSTIRTTRALLLAVAGSSLLMLGLSGCSSPKEDTPAIYKGQPGDKMPPAGFSTSGKSATPSAGSKKAD